MEHLNDSTTYSPIPLTLNYVDNCWTQLENIISSYTAITQTLWHKHLLYMKNHLKLKPAATFYCIPKIHKQTDNGRIPGRPIAASISTITQNTSIYLNNYLQRLLPHIPTVVSSSKSAAKQLLYSSNITSLKDCVIATADVDALYPNIPTNRGLDAINHILQQTHIPKAKIQFIIKLLDWVLNNNYVTFNNLTYLQISGTAMGTNVAPVYAQLVMFQVELHHYRNFIYYLRYIDDVIAIAASRDIAENTINQLQHTWPTIKLNSIVIGQQSNFLDLNIRITENGMLDFSIYQKPQNNYQYIPASSAHPPAVLKSFVYSELRRYRTTSTTEEHFIKIATLFHIRIANRGYPSSLFEKAFSYTISNYSLLQVQPLSRPVTIGTLGLDRLTIHENNTLQRCESNLNPLPTLQMFRENTQPLNINFSKKLILILCIPGISRYVKWKQLFQVPPQLLETKHFQLTYKTPTLIIAKKLTPSIGKTLIHSKFC
jgi:hypothetical protein